MNVLSIFGLLIMTLAGTFGAIFFKRASTSIENGSPFILLKNKNLYIGGGFYLIGAILNILLLRKIDYTIVYPMTSLTYVWTMFVSYFFFKEKINKYKIMAMILIVSGAIIINL